MDQLDLLRSIPATEPPTIAVPADSRRGIVRHSCLNYWEIAAGRFVNVEVNCEYLRVVSTFPVVLLADGQPLVADTDLTAVAFGAPTLFFQPQRFATVPLLRPVTSFAVRRSITRLSVRLVNNTTDYTTGDAPGACHIWTGPADTDVADFGLPVSHTTENAYSGAAVSSFELPMPILLHGGQASLASGLSWRPSRTLINGAFVVPTWVATAGVISVLYVAHVTAGGGRFFLTVYRPNVTPFDYDFGVPLEVASYMTETWNADGRGGLVLGVVATQTFNALTGGLRCNSYL